jgi:hypothetical protein
MQAHRFDESNQTPIAATGLAATDHSRQRGRFAGLTPSFSTRASQGRPTCGEPTLSPNATHLRLARFQRECDVVIGPVLLLAAASAVLVFALGLNALLEEATPAPAAEPTQQRMSPAT